MPLSHFNLSKEEEEFLAEDMTRSPKKKPKTEELVKNSWTICCPLKMSHKAVKNISQENLDDSLIFGPTQRDQEEV